MNIALVGLGKIGLPLAAQFAKMGHQVTGVDINGSLVDSVNRGQEPFPGETGLAEALAETVNDGRLCATTNYSEAIPGADTVVVAVPLLVDEKSWEPDFIHLDSATHSIAGHLVAGTLVVYETTLPVGTTRGRWKPLIEDISGLKEGEDFHLVFSPERVLTGRVFDDLRKYPKLIGGMSEEASQRARDFYESVLVFDQRDDLPQRNGVWDMGSPEAAEMAKLAETTYRDVNIALANQFAMYADTIGVDVHQIIDACNSQPYSHIHRPGIAVGGHCIPVYPRLYLSTDPDAEIVRSARELNVMMPRYMVQKTERYLGSLSAVKVVVLGAAYRGGVKETAVSGVFPLVQELVKRGAVVAVHDPMFSARELKSLGLAPYEYGEQVDAAILQADHAEYLNLEPRDLPGIQLLIDGRNFVNHQQWQGVRVITIGVGGDLEGMVPDRQKFS